MQASKERDQARTSLRWLGQDNSRFSHGNSTKLWGELEYSKTTRWTKGIDLEPNTFGDRLEKWIFHLESMEFKELAEEASKGVPTEEGALGRIPTHPWRRRSPEERFWRGRHCSDYVQREKRREKEATNQGFKYPWTYARRTLSRPTEHCLGRPDFVWFRLCLGEGTEIGFSKKNWSFEARDMDFIETKYIYIYKDINM
jgi:hypothetical protein